MAVAFLCAAVFFAAWPWSAFQGQVFVQRDSLFATVGLVHLQNVLLGSAALGQAPLAWPFPDGFAQNDWMMGQALLSLPLRLLQADPAYQYGALALLGLLATALACQQAARLLLGAGMHTWAAGLLGGLNCAQLAHAQHINLVHGQCLVLGLVLLVAGLERGRAGLAFAGGLCAACSFHFGVYLGLQAMLACAVFGVAALLAGRRAPRVWAGALGGLFLGLASVVPVLAAYAAHSARFDVWLGPHALINESLDISRLMAPLERVAVHQPLQRFWPRALPPFRMLPANPGYFASLLALFGAWRLWRGRAAAGDQGRGPGWVWWALAALLLLAGALALGPNLVWMGRPSPLLGPYRLLLELPGADSLRSPVRWLGLCWCALGFFAAAGLAAVLRSRLRGRTLLALAALGLLLAELPRSESGALDDIQPGPAYAALARLEGPGALADLLDNDDGDPFRGQKRIRAMLFHGRPVAGGRFARCYDALKRAGEWERRWPSSEARRFLALIGVRAVLEHRPSRRRPAGAECAPAGEARLCLLQQPLPRPLPLPEEVSERPSGPIIGARWPGNLGRVKLGLRCDEGAQQREQAELWQLLAEIRGQTALDVFLDEPCQGTLQLEPAGAVPLYLAAGATGAPWPGLPAAQAAFANPPWAMP